jgi:hypothetical protein
LSCRLRDGPDKVRILRAIGQARACNQWLVLHALHSVLSPKPKKQPLGIVGLVPDVTETDDVQLSRVMMQLGHKNSDLDRYIYLVGLLDTTDPLLSDRHV